MWADRAWCCVLRKRPLTICISVPFHSSSTSGHLLYATLCSGHLGRWSEPPDLLFLSWEAWAKRYCSVGQRAVMSLPWRRSFSQNAWHIVGGQ